MASGKEK